MDPPLSAEGSYFAWLYLYKAFGGLLLRGFQGNLTPARSVCATALEVSRLLAKKHLEQFVRQPFALITPRKSNHEARGLHDGLEIKLPSQRITEKHRLMGVLLVNDRYPMLLDEITELPRLIETQRPNVLGIASHAVVLVASVDCCRARGRFCSVIHDL